MCSPAGFILGVVFFFNLNSPCYGGPNRFMTLWRDIRNSVLGYRYFLPSPASHFDPNVEVLGRVLHTRPYNVSCTVFIYL